MSVKYKLVQDNRTTSVNKGKWYGRAVINDVVHLEDISQEIQDNTSAKQADVWAVLKELVNSVNRHLQNGDRVVLDGFGSFKVGLKTKPADTPTDFTPGANIVGARVNFQPETHWTATDRKHRKQFLVGLETRLIEGGKPKDGDGTAQPTTP